MGKLVSPSVPRLTWYRCEGEEVRFGGWNFDLFRGLFIAGLAVFTNWFIWDKEILPGISGVRQTGSLPSSFHSFNGHPSGPAGPVLLTLFFGAVGAFLAWLACKHLLGTVEIAVRGDDGAVVEAIGPLRRTRRFRLSEVRRVSITRGRYLGRGYNPGYIVIHRPEPLTFATWLPETRRDFIVARLQAEVTKRGVRASVERR
jgi:hypothetical protein